MQVIDNEQIVYFDVDDTLVMWSTKEATPHKGAVKFTDPYDGSVHYLKPHKRHIDLLKKYRGRKNFVIVHSAGGVRWAESVIKTLKLQSYVDVVLTKPTKYIDDLRADEWFGHRIYIKD